MKQQATIQTPKQTLPPQAKGLLPHAAVRAPSDHELLENSSAGSRFAHDFSQVAVRRSSVPIVRQSCSNISGPPRIQAKLKIGKPGDRYEQEADRVAEQVMQMPEPRVSSSAGGSANGVNSSSGTIQRACAPCSAEYKAAEDENRSVEPANLCPKCRTQGEGLIQAKQIAPIIQRQENSDVDEELVQAKMASNLAPVVTPDISSGIRALQGGGRPMSGSELGFFEPRFGADFSGVRVHDGARAAGVARSVGARAFTVGRDVVFGGGEYSLGGLAGRRLLAHELTHVVQQNHDRRSLTPSVLAHELTHVIQQTGNKRIVQRLIRTPYPWLGVITPAIGANIRSATDSSDPSNKLDAIPQGETVNVLSSSGNWLRVESRYRGPVLVGYIYHTLVDDAASRSMEASTGTTMVWRPSGPGSGTDFEMWASAPTETPFPAVTATTIMNCWEAVLLSAYRAGAINWNWIHNIYTAVPIADWVTNISRGVMRTYSIPGPNLHTPQRGDLVFFDGLAHVALATGNGSEVYTFWPPPNTPFTAGGTTDKVKTFTIEALVSWWVANMPPAPVVEFSAPSW